MVLCKYLDSGYSEGMCPTLSETTTTTTNNPYYGEGKAYSPSESLWVTVYDQYIIDTVIHK